MWPGLIVNIARQPLILGDMNVTNFSQIIAATIPCHKIYKDAKTMAFLDTNSAQPRYALVIPKTGVTFIWDLVPEGYSALTETVKK